MHNALVRRPTVLSSEAVIPMAPQTSYVGLGDVMPNVMSAYWGLRAYSYATIGVLPAIKLRRNSDNATSDFGTTSGGRLDISAIRTFAGNANLFVDTWYDQSASGNNIHFLQATQANQPPFILAPPGLTQPAIQLNSSTPYTMATTNTLTYPTPDPSVSYGVFCYLNSTHATAPQIMTGDSLGGPILDVNNSGVNNEWAGVMGGAEATTGTTAAATNTWTSVDFTSNGGTGNCKPRIYVEGSQGSDQTINGVTGHTVHIELNSNRNGLNYWDGYITEAWYAVNAVSGSTAANIPNLYWTALHNNKHGFWG